MIKETVLELEGTNIITESGRKRPIGNRAYEVGEAVWTEGKYALGTDKHSQPINLSDEGVNNSTDIFIWAGIDDDTNTLHYRVYKADNMNYVQMKVNLPDDVDVSNADNVWFAYNALGNKIAWLLYYANEFKLVIMDAEGKTTTKTISHDYANYGDFDSTNVDLYIDSNNNVIVRCFYPAGASKVYDIIANQYVDDGSQSAKIKYYTNGELTKTSTISGATLLADLTDLQSIADNAVITSDITLKFFGRVNNTQNYVELKTDRNMAYVVNINNAVNAAYGKDIGIEGVTLTSHTVTSGNIKELNKRKPSSGSSAYLENWEDEQIYHSCVSNASIFIVPVFIGGDNVTYYTSYLELQGIDSLTISYDDENFNFWSVAIAKFGFYKKFLYKNGTKNKLLGYTVDYDRIDNNEAEQIEIKGYNIPTPTDTNYWMLPTRLPDVSTFQYYPLIAKAYAPSIPIGDIETNTYENVIHLDDSFILNTTTDILTNGTYTCDLSSASVTLKNYKLPVFTNLTGSVILDGTIIKKKDSSTSTLVSGGASANTRMPLIKGAALSDIAILLRN